jgi:outer membrane immunogenic protein
MISLRIVRCCSGVIMNKLLVGGIAIAALIAGPAIAADMPAPAPVAVESWTGFYAGASLGGRFTDSNWMTTCLSVGAPAASAAR